MAYGPGVNEINYSDLPPTGDTVNSAFQKTQNQFDALYTGLNGDIVRASEADVNTATDITKLVTPGTLLKGKVNGVASLNSSGKVTETELPLASTTVKGVMELATPEEVLAGTDNERAVTPATLTTKILGTVSQVGGVPTGAVIESGSNANGSYVKFADGTAICRKSVAWVGTETYRPTTTLPITITSATHMCQFIISSSETSFLVFSVDHLTSSTIYYWVQEVASTGTVTKRSGAVTVKILVIGRWF